MKNFGVNERLDVNLVDQTYAGEVTVDLKDVKTFTTDEPVTLRLDVRGPATITAGDIKARISKVIRPPEGEVYHSIESPKGELGYYIVSDGKSTNAYRCHVRPPSIDS